MMESTVFLILSNRIKFLTGCLFFLTNCLSELFQKIELPEVLLWAEKQSEELSPNLTKFTEHFNNMSYWVRTIILTQPDAKIREKLMIRFIKVMKVSA